MINTTLNETGNPYEETYASLVVLSMWFVSYACLTTCIMAWCAMRLRRKLTMEEQAIFTLPTGRRLKPHRREQRNATLSSHNEPVRAPAFVDDGSVSL